MQIDQAQYKTAIPFFEEYLTKNSLPPETIAEVGACIGFAQAKSGNNEGIQTIHDSIQALENIDPQTIQNKDIILIKKLGAQLKLAQVIEDREEAIRLVEQVKQEAEENGLGARVKQAGALLKELSQ